MAGWKDRLLVLLAVVLPATGLAGEEPPPPRKQEANGESRTQQPNVVKLTAEEREILRQLELLENLDLLEQMDVVKDLPLLGGEGEK